jgi:hypothetical protein
MKLTHLGLLVAAMLAATSAEAVTTYNFSYVATGGTLAGQLTGTLQADNNTVLVSSIVDFASWNAVPGPSLTFVNTLSGYFSNIFAPGIVTIDGSVMDILACTSTVCSEGFLLTTLDPLGFNSGTAFGAALEPYSQAGWSLSAAVPEPANWALMITGFGLVGSALRRRRVAVAA